jgi:heterotetrameric sarcosine oxidase gamma subunit
VVDHRNSELAVERLDDLAIVSLRVSHGGLVEAIDQLQLAHSGVVSGSDPQSLWIGPGRWLLMSRSATSGAIISSCEQALTNCVYNAVDYSSALAAFCVSGEIAEQVLASGTGVDLRPEQFPTDSCCRTRIAQIGVIVVAVSEGRYKIYADRSYEVYLKNWLAETSGILSLKCRR